MSCPIIYLELEMGRLHLVSEWLLFAELSAFKVGASFLAIWRLNLASTRAGKRDKWIYSIWIFQNVSLNLVLFCHFDTYYLLSPCLLQKFRPFLCTGLGARAGNFQTNILKRYGKSDLKKEIRKRDKNLFPTPAEECRIESSIVFSRVESTWTPTNQARHLSLSVIIKTLCLKTSLNFECL